MAEDKKKYKLSNLQLDEVSFVDSPACRLAKVVIFKRAEDTVEKVSGVQFNIGFREGGGSEVQSVVFDSKQWDRERAASWLKDHNMHAGKVDETENTLRYRQADPAGFTRFRMITPGAQLAKVMTSPEDYQKTMLAVDKAIRQKFQKNLMVRDIIGDSVYFEHEGNHYRADYTIEKQKGALAVTISDKTSVALVYKDLGKQEAESAVPPELVFKMGQLKARTAFLERRMNRISKDSRDKGLHLIS